MQNDPMDPRRKALVDAMGGQTGYGGVPNTSSVQGPPSPIPSSPLGGGKDRGVEMPGTGSSGGVEDASRMLGEATARNKSLSDLGHRRAKLDIFDRAGHEGLDREESSIFGGAPRSSYVSSGDMPGGASSPQTLAPKPDSSKWNTDGYATPGYTAQNAGGVLSGFDATKWNDPNHQSPKYVFGRILQEAAGGDGRLETPEQRDAAVKNILQAYPGATFDGKQKVTMPDGGVIDIFQGADAGHYGAAFQVEPGTGRDAAGNPIDTSSPGAPAGGGGGGLSSLNPMLQGNAQDGIQQALSSLTQRSPSLEELLKQLTGGQQ